LLLRRIHLGVQSSSFSLLLAHYQERLAKGLLKAEGGTTSAHRNLWRAPVAVFDIA
jgi:hypothetical protein